MKKVIWFCTLFFFLIEVKAQVQQVVPAGNTEQQLENIAGNNDDAEVEDDSYLIEMEHYKKNPVNINSVTETVLKTFRVLTPMQIESFLSYRNVLGKFINIYELQAVPGWDIATIQKIKNYLTVNEKTDIITSLRRRIQGGEHTVLMRVSQVMEKSQGYLANPLAGKNYYKGSPQKIFARYRYNYKNLLQYGVVAEKDAGEQFFKGDEKQGFDFYSAHFFLGKAGIVKSLALGDFTVNMGQGLVQWMNLAFKKGPDVLSVKRQAEVLRPYNSAGETNFHRGVGVTVAKNRWEATIFVSHKKTDANFISDTLYDFVSSLQTSGLHRTKSELADKAVQRQLAFGGNFSYQLRKLHLGLNAVQYHFKYPLLKQAEPYNLYALNGNNFGNYSADYGYTHKNFHLYGEAAVTNKYYPAFVHGLLISAASNVDMSFVYRNISKGYQSLYTNAFTESSFPTNEKGFFTGLTVRPSYSWRLESYFDFYKFSWLKYRVNAPSAGSDYLLQLTYTPGKEFEMYARIKSETKSLNYNAKDAVLRPVASHPKQNVRAQFSYKITREFNFRSRVEALWYDRKGETPENGFLLFADILYTPYLKKYSGNIRLQYFETDGYNSRLYAYENDVLYSYSIPLFYGKGYRLYFNANADITPALTAWLKIASYLYTDKSNIGSGLDFIDKSHKTEVKLQFQYKF